MKCVNIWHTTRWWIALMIIYFAFYFFYVCINSCNTHNLYKDCNIESEINQICLTITHNHQMFPSSSSCIGESSNLTPWDLSHARHHALITSPACCERRGGAWDVLKSVGFWTLLKVCSCHMLRKDGLHICVAPWVAHGQGTHDLMCLDCDTGGV